MQALAAAAFLFLLIALGWKQPFESHWQQVTGKTTTTAAKQGLRNGQAYGPSGYGGGAAGSAPTATPQDRSWLFQRTILDPPSNRR